MSIRTKFKYASQHRNVVEAMFGEQIYWAYVYGASARTLGGLFTKTAVREGDCLPSLETELVGAAIMAALKTMEE